MTPLDRMILMAMVAIDFGIYFLFLATYKFTSIWELFILGVPVLVLPVVTSSLTYRRLFKARLELIVDDVELSLVQNNIVIFRSNWASMKPVRVLVSRNILRLEIKDLASTGHEVEINFDFWRQVFWAANNLRHEHATLQQMFSNLPKGLIDLETIWER